jgi:glycosyltransferase involved in cell wall biosynthesis
MSCPNLSELPPPSLGKIGWPWTEESKQLPDAMPDGSPWPRISIVTPSYNQAIFVEETIRSVLLQGYPNLEYIIIDGKSTDNSVTLIQKYEKWLTSWISEPDKGQSEAINKGWRRSTGELIAYINSDDLYNPGTFSRVAQFFSQNPTIGIVYGAYLLINGQGSIRYSIEAPDFDLAQLLLSDFIGQPTVFLRSSVLRQIGELDPTLQYVMDYEFLLRAALDGIQLAKVPGDPMAQFRLWSGSKSTGKSDKDLCEELAMLERCFANPKLPPHLHILRRQSMARAAISVAYGYYLATDMVQARRLLHQAFAFYKPIIFKGVFLNVFFKSRLGPRISKWLREIRRMYLQLHTRQNRSGLNDGR